jgi:Ca2+-binding RTX toxin-like protein
MIKKPKQWNMIMMDIAAPILKSLTFASRFDIRSGSKPIEFVASAEDDLSGIHKFAIHFDHAFTYELGTYSVILLDLGTNGAWSISRSLSEYNGPGFFTINGVSLTDKAGNERFYGVADLARIGASTTFELITESYNPTDGDDELSGSNKTDVLKGRSGNDLIEGLDGADTLYGGAGEDTLKGGEGNDTLFGDGGNDTFYVDGSPSLIFQREEIYGGDGIDTIIANGSFKLNTASGIELLKASAAASRVSLIGDGGNNHLIGTGSNDTLEGSGGLDTLEGGAGNDTYVVGDSAVVLQDTSGIDAVDAEVSFTLPSGIEHVSGFFFNTNPLTLRGNEERNRIEGGGGNDKLYGGLGADTLEGGFGKDVYVFDAKLSARNNKNVDRIEDFASFIGERIWLSRSVFSKLGKKGGEKKPVKLDSKSFVSGTKALDADDRLIYNQKSGKLSYDSDGSGKQKPIHFATFDKQTAVLAKDFYLI